MRDVKEKVKQLNIQLDNLCQFLPQDKVRICANTGMCGLGSCCSCRGPAHSGTVNIQLGSPCHLHGCRQSKLAKQPSCQQLVPHRMHRRPVAGNPACSIGS